MPALLDSNTFQLAMGSDGQGRSFASLCYDNLVWLYATDATTTLPLAIFTDGVSSSVQPAGAASASTFLNMTCAGSNGVKNGGERRTAWRAHCP